jgi:predicted protein tyrosine phosphatase
MGAGRIFVGPMWAIGKAREIGAAHAVTLINSVEMPGIVTPAHITPEDHLRLVMSDIDHPEEGRIMPAAEHVQALLAFLARWRREAPLLIHCRAGLSRSPAAAFIVLCALNPEADELALARQLGEAGRLINPNRRMVWLADEVMRRNGRMVAAMDVFAGAPRLEEGELFSFDAVSK